MRVRPVRANLTRVFRGSGGSGMRKVGGSEITGEN